MLRLETATGWWLVTHPDHAHLAGEFAAAWGNALFPKPTPHAHVLRGIYAHDDGWRERDASPVITKDGKPAGFSTELVGTYSAFEEIDLVAYLAVRREAVQRIAQQDPYAAILISMHTHNLLSARADRTTIHSEQLPWLDAFLVEQLTLQRALREQLINEGNISAADLSLETLERNFQLLQACDNLSLLSCVDYAGDATLLHSFDTAAGATEIRVQRIGERSFRLTPHPLAQSTQAFRLTARHVLGRTFASSEELRNAFHEAPQQQIAITVTA